MKPLSGIRVLDLTKVLAGPMCTQYLGDLGAEIIKIEPLGVGDETRQWPPFRAATGSVFLSCNWNKKSVAVDLKTARGREIVHRLARDSDVVVESFGTGVSGRLGVDYETLRAINDKLIYCSISGFGRTGPLANALGYDVIAQAFSGIMSMTGEPGGGPVRSPFSPVDQTTGTHAASGILAALMNRTKTGEGACLEVSLFETAVAFLGYNLQIFWEKGMLPEKCGSGHESLCPYQAFDASDKPVLLGIANDNLWRRFCKAVEREAWIDDPRFRTNPDRVKNRAATISAVQELIRQRSSEDWVPLLTENGVPCAAINSIADMLNHEHTVARGIVLDYQHPELGALKTIAQPIVFNGAKRTPGSPPPRHGQSTQEVLTFLGYSQGEIDSFARSRVIELAETSSGSGEQG
ncbi:CaiB/BaiF CoA transferase family protein [Bradyrhizobium lablabi]|uniref:Crotonobetainyl-CoA:carnitine CoA-transferase CaiB n=3 Tax=Bradyrhizobium TaxID=374 RepID=A0ABY0PHM2_9BRAD|nr:MULTISPECIES: CoA transferase [Bradyrhizobium]SDI18125.1 Crotonobetainyl-CoA:carnitine CoA-transferase CaiB [Bradyrhizobium ottawaense]SED76093.1 Crotonobetainyl-CoA:carnitine CoA-transferase CaiB [Bradyrhizobium lablabi]SHL71651.1 Crotonobetainyl-CoA:carnitine CoA-transferase CaiB [Bradyrhizobium lablabi]